MPRSLPKLSLAVIASVAMLAASTPAQAAPPPSPLFSKKLNDGKTTLRGFVDMHAHPMSHLGFGGHVVHGAPDVGILMPAGQIWRNNDCNHEPEKATNKNQALGSCYAAHAGHDFIKNKCGNHIRRMVLNGVEDGNHANKPHDIDHPQGAPTFTRWPKHDDILHQQMWVEWVERAYKGGMRVMVALAVNNYTLAHGIETSPANPRKDKASGNLQIRQLKKFVEQNPFMEIAYSAADLRRIVGEKDKLAVVIGVELDDLGDFVVDKKNPSPEAVRQELRRLHGLGVRYAFPVHLIDNLFAGTATYEDELNRANCFHYGSWWKLTCSNDAGKDEAGIRHKVGAGDDYAAMMKIGGCGGTAPVPKCGEFSGHKNSRGLTTLGKEAIREMMRLGMIIDVDHASLASFQGIMAETGKTPAGAYPVVSGHNGLRGQGEHSDNENARTKGQYQEIAKRKGIAGVGWGSLRADQWRDKLASVHATGVHIALGSDINGLVVQPTPRSGCSPAKPCVKYSTAFPKPTFGDKSWNYNRDGVAHVGLFPDVLRDVEGQEGGAQLVDALFNGAEGFAVTWERAESVGKTVPPPDTAGKIAIVKAEYGRNCGIDATKANITKWVKEQCSGLLTCNYKFTWEPWGGDPNPSMCQKEIVINWQCGTKSRSTKVLHTKTPQTVPVMCP